MNDTILQRLQELVEKSSEYSYSLLCGTIAKDVTVRFTNNGDAWVAGSVKCTRTSPNGKGKPTIYYANFTAFGEKAEQMVQLKPGDKVLLLTERHKRKGKDGKYYDGDLVVEYVQM
jgi:single-stranded DNA-binding protein